jgi:hypothetical protein
VKLEILLIVILLPLFISGNSVHATVEGSQQVGATADEASKGNTGVSVEILTHAYELNEAISWDYFWVGETLANTAFIQFGYILQQPGYQCLRSYTKEGNTTCSSGGYVGKADPRWFWAYWPNAILKKVSEGWGYESTFYEGGGLTGSAGTEGTWHNYSIVPDPVVGWDFVLDGLVVDKVAFPSSSANSPPSIVAEESLPCGRNFTQSFSGMGPVEFRNFAYLKDGVFRPITSLKALVTGHWNCNTTGAKTMCDFTNPYGVSVLSENHIVAGQGIARPPAGQLLWTAPTMTATAQIISSIFVSTTTTITISNSTTVTKVTSTSTTYTASTTSTSIIQRTSTTTIRQTSSTTTTNYTTK